MLRIARHKNKVTVVLVEDDRFVKRETFSQGSIQEAQSAAITARIMRDNGYGYVAISTFLTYGRI